MKKFVITILIAAGVVGAAYYIKDLKILPSGAPSERPEQRAECLGTEVTHDRVKYCGQDEKNAFELLQSVAEVGFKKYDFGVFVESINGVSPDSKHFWKLIVNGQDAQAGADQLQTKNGDIIEWKLDEIK